jgi:hypothetical protein
MYSHGMMMFHSQLHYNLNLFGFHTFVKVDLHFVEITPEFANTSEYNFESFLSPPNRPYVDTYRRKHIVDFIRGYKRAYYQSSIKIYS